MIGLHRGPFRMKSAPLFLAGLCLGSAFNVQAVVWTDTVVQGSVCVGSDCSSSEVFAAPGVTKLKENNTRLRFYDNTAGTFPVRQEFSTGYVEGEIGDSWRIDANQSVSGGVNHFFLSQLGLKGEVVLSDGTAPEYDCASLTYPRPVVGTIPEGQPTQNPDAGCEPFMEFVSIAGMALDGSLTGGVALGAETEVAAGQVTIGNAELRRRLARVAAAVQETDALIKAQLDAGLLAERSQAVDEIEALLDLAEAEISELETRVAPPPLFGSGNGGIGSASWLLVLLALVGLRLRRLRDQN